MGKKLYKYAGPAIVSRVFSQEGVGALKCSRPNDFNDPYELFLTIDYDQPPDVLAYYREVIGELPQLPTTCFSTSPSIVRMWAHYASNHEGFVLEIDEDRLSETFPDLMAGDVDYRTEANPAIADMLVKAHTTCKPRHTYFLQRAVFSAAYYTKHTCWSYEQERRLVLNADHINNLDGTLLFYVPLNCISAIILGHRARDQTNRTLADVADQAGCPILQMHIGRSTLLPYFRDGSDKVFLYQDGELLGCDYVCAGCGEPTRDERDTCAWCLIQDKDEFQAASRNPMRMLEKYGMLDDYYDSVEKIRRGRDEV